MRLGAYCETPAEKNIQNEKRLAKKTSRFLSFLHELPRIIHEFSMNFINDNSCSIDDNSC